MSLIDLKTNLKDLRYGNDRLGGGDSGQPYVQARIPAADVQLTAALETGGTDFLLRGGMLLPKYIANDEIRLGKFFTSTEGLLFTAKQNLLSRTAVRTQTSTGILNEGIYTPISTLLEVAGNAFGIHVNKQGLNPLGGIGGLTTYSEAIADEINSKDKLNNRLSSLYAIKIASTENDSNNNVSPLLFEKFSISRSDNNTLSYQGGPGSILGIGKTYIKFATNIGGAPLRTIYDGTETSPLQQNNVVTYTNDEIGNIEEADGSLPDTPVYIGGTGITTPGDFRAKLRNKANDNLEIGLIPSSVPNYISSRIENRVKLGDPGNRNGKVITDYTIGVGGNGEASRNSYDEINATTIYQSDKANFNFLNDLVKFAIGVYDLKTSPIKKNYIHFRAFLNQISDNYTSEWNSTQYIGRGEKFYNYTGFDRKVSLSWTVAAQSKAELMPMYRRLNYLASICTPDYSSQGYMRGNIVTLTIGGYFYEQPGIIQGFSYEMNDENSTWEIGINTEGGSDSSVKELPHMIKVSGFNFIPIHTFVPKTQQNTFKSNGDLTEYGPEHYIALSAGGPDNYTI